MNNLEFSFLGRMNYDQAQILQNDLAILVKKTKTTAIIGLEHPAVITRGYRLRASDEFSKGNMSVVQSSRGGMLTIHSEGQLVIYPIVNLREHQWGVKEYVLKLLETTQYLLNQFGIESFIDDQAVGLFTERGKIAFCGIQVKNGITTHGISLNVRNDLNLFKNIESCGVQKAQLDRLQNYDVNLTLKEIFNQWVNLFTQPIRS